MESSQVIKLASEAITDEIERMGLANEFNPHVTLELMDCTRDIEYKSLNYLVAVTAACSNHKQLLDKLRHRLELHNKRKLDYFDKVRRLIEDKLSEERESD